MSVNRKIIFARKALQHRCSNIENFPLFLLIRIHPTLIPVHIFIYNKVHKFDNVFDIIIFLSDLKTQMRSLPKWLAIIKTSTWFPFSSKFPPPPPQSPNVADKWMPYQFLSSLTKKCTFVPKFSPHFCKILYIFLSYYWCLNLKMSGECVSHFKGTEALEWSDTIIVVIW